MINLKCHESNISVCLLLFSRECVCDDDWFWIAQCEFTWSTFLSKLRDNFFLSLLWYNVMTRFLWLNQSFAEHFEKSYFVISRFSHFLKFFDVNLHHKHFRDILNLVRRICLQYADVHSLKFIENEIREIFSFTWNMSHQKVIFIKRQFIKYVYFIENILFLIHFADFDV